MVRLIGAIVVILLTAAAGRAAEIDWRVLHPFRYFQNTTDFDMHREAMADVLAVRSGDSADPVSDLERVVNDPRWLRQWYKASPSLYPDGTKSGRAERGWANPINNRRATCWDSREQWHSSCASDSFGRQLRTDYVLPQGHRVVLSVKDAPAGTCRWTTGRPALIDGTSRLTASRSVDCGAQLLAWIPYAPDAPDAQAGVDVSLTLPDGTSPPGAHIVVRDRLVVGIGDSYSSGEGNPDTPVQIEPRPVVSGRNISFVYDAEEQALRSVPSYSVPSRYENVAAGWLDRKCHRSAYSYHLRTALQIALADAKHSAVTFLGYACSGAEITEGFMQPYAGVESVSTGYFTAAGRIRRDMPQLDRLMVELCRDDLTEHPRRRTVTFDRPITGKGGGSISSVKLLDCPDGRFLRKIDVLIVSIGGNDVGFTPLIVDVLTRSRPTYADAITRARAALLGAPVLRRLASLVKAHGVTEAGKKAAELPDRFAALGKALSRFPIAAAGGRPNLILTAFPKVEFDQNGKLCGEADPRERMEGLNVGGVLAIDVPELRNVSSFVNNTLQPRLKAAAAAGNWHFVDSHRDVFRTHGVCAQKRSANGVTAFESLMLPYYAPGSPRNLWKDFEPLSSYRDSDFLASRDTRPYAPRQRWFRTLNDICLFVQYKRNGSPPTGANFGLADLLESCMGGPFHPTAEGHAHIADAVYAEASRIFSLPKPSVAELRQH